MAKYLITGSYTAAAWAAQIADPKNRIEVVRPAFEKMVTVSPKKFCSPKDVAPPWKITRG